MPDQTLEQRVSALEREVAELKSHGANGRDPKPWLRRSGDFRRRRRDERDFDEALKLHEQDRQRRPPSHQQCHHRPSEKVIVLDTDCTFRDWLIMRLTESENPLMVAPADGIGETLDKSRSSTHDDGYDASSLRGGTGHDILALAALVVSCLRQLYFLAGSAYRRPPALAARRYPLRLRPAHRDLLVSPGGHYRRLSPRLQQDAERKAA